MDDNIVFDDLAVYLESEEHLILSDLHLGLAESNPDLDIESEIESVTTRVKELIDTYEPRGVVLNGDVFHHFPFPSEGVSFIDKIENYLSDRAGSLMLTTGNHEEKIGGYGDDISDIVSIFDEYPIDNSDTIITHGHHTPTTPADLFVIGHIHPIVIDGDDRVPCYLYGEDAVYGADVIILPAFTSLVDGMNVENPYSPKGHCPFLADGDSISEYTIHRPELQ